MAGKIYVAVSELEPWAPGLIILHMYLVTGQIAPPDLIKCLPSTLLIPLAAAFK